MSLSVALGDKVWPYYFIAYLRCLPTLDLLAFLSGNPSTLILLSSASSSMASQPTFLRLKGQSLVYAVTACCSVGFMLFGYDLGTS